MKIVYAASRPENIGGGETKVAFDMARRMAKDHEVLILHPSQHDDTLIEKEGNLTKYGVRSVSNGNIYTPKLDIGEIRKLKRYITRFDPDIAHSHTIIWLGQILQDWAIKHGTPFFYTTHILPSKAAEWTENDSTKSVAKKFTDSGLFKDYIKSFYNSCSIIITLNDESHDDLKRFGYKGESYIIPNGLSLELFRDLEQPDPEEDEVRLLYTGSISKRKRTHFLVESMAHLPSNYHLYIAGGVDVDIAYGNSVKNYIKKHKLDNVHLLGKLPYEEIPKQLEKAHYFVFASKAEVQSLSIIEALAAGKPVVAIENQTSRELINDSNGKLLPAETTPEHFAEAVVEMHSNLEEYSQRCKNAKELANMFDYDTVINQTVDAYSRHLEDAPNSNSSATSKVFAAAFIAGTLGLYLGVKAYKKAKRSRN
ncbi:MAG: glycosyltransferase [Candidatus Dojkabacteria bacterium]|nr:MAG: glycosyltransferase [Candidatus Dojkabacteria bacterium]